MDRRIFFEKASHYRGRAKIRLRNFELERIDVRTIHDKQVSHLAKSFQGEGCFRLNPDNYVKALINSNALHRALRSQNLEGNDLRDGEPPLLNLPASAKVKILHGRHRILAARKCHDLTWWVAELYSGKIVLALTERNWQLTFRIELPADIASVIREEDPNAKQYCDGDIYRSIRYYEAIGNVTEQEKWLARLTPDKRKRIDCMDKRFRRLKQAFTRLLHFTGLWADLKLGYLGYILSLGCEEVLFS
jgi:hypothetical protein